MSRTVVWIGLGVAVVAGMLASHRLGSRADTNASGPVAPCPDRPNCARVAVALSAPAAVVREAARAALADVGAVDVADDVGLWVGTAPMGPFQDDVAIGVEPTATGSTLWVRSASRVGRSDLGVNARRVAHLVDAVRQRVGG